MAESSDMIEVTVKTLDSQSRTYGVRGELTVRQFKEHIAASVEIPVSKQRLIYQGRVLQDDRTLTEYNVDGKVIHLVERAPPQTSTQPGSGGAGVSTGGAEPGPASSSSQGAAHDRNGNSYVMLGTFNVPVNIMDPIQMSVQQMMAGMGEAGRARVSTSTGSSGSVDVQISVDQSQQSEVRVHSQARFSLNVAGNMLRDAHALIYRLEEGVSADSGSHSDSEVSQSSPVPSTSSESGPTASQSTQTGQSAGPSASSNPYRGTASSWANDPSPAELMEALSEVRRVEERLRPFIERTHSILGAATSADYNNNTEEREEDQRVLNLVGDALRLLGHSLVMLGDLRCDLSRSPPRHLHLRPIAPHAHMPIPINRGTTVTMTSNGRANHPPQTVGQSEQPAPGQAPPSASNASNQQQEQGVPRMIRITHQTMEPVVMMQMNIEGELSGQAPGQQNTADPGPPGVPPFPGLPPEFMQAIVHQISHQAAAMASAAAQPAPAASTSTPPAPAQARVVITRPAFSPRGPQPPGARGTTINLRATVPPTGQPGQAPPVPPAALTQIISGLMGQLLQPGHSDDPVSPESPPPPPGQTSAPGSSAASVGQPAEGSAEGGLAQLLGSLLGAGAAHGGPPPGSAPSITVTLPGAPLILHSDITPPPGGHAHPAPPQPPAPAPMAGIRGGEEPLSPELFSGIVQGVLSTVMSSMSPQQGTTGESIAQFIQRLSQTNNLFTLGSGEAGGFFGELLSLLCQSFSLVDMVLLLHGNAQPLTRIQPQLTGFFSRHYLQGREPSDHNIQAAAEELINSLEEYITESFATVTVREGVDIVQTNLSFFRQQFAQMATHILRCNDHTFGPRLLLLCTQALFECLALNLFCVRGEQSALSSVINHRIRRMSAEVNPSLVNWLTWMMSSRLHLILEHNPVTEEHIQHYVVHTQPQNQGTDMERTQPRETHNGEMEERLSPVAATTAEEAMACPGDRADRGPPADSSGDRGGQNPTAAPAPGSTVREEGPAEPEPWAAAVPPEWVPIIRHDMLSQRKIKAQPPLSDAYLHGMPAKRRKTSQGEGPALCLSDAVSRAARTAGVLPLTAASSLQGELERPELQEAYTRQVKQDIQERVRDDPDYSAHRFPNTHRAFSTDDS